MIIELEPLELEELRDISFYTNKDNKRLKSVLYNNDLQQFEASDGKVAIVVKRQIDNLDKKLYKIKLLQTGIELLEFKESQGAYSVSRLFKRVLEKSNCGEIEEKQTELKFILDFLCLNTRKENANKFLAESSLNLRLNYLIHLPKGFYEIYVPTAYTLYWYEFMADILYFKSNINLGKIKILTSIK